MEDIKLDLNNIPSHIALILDGNGRWAKKRLMPRTYGHRKGAFNIVDVAKSCSKLKVKVISLYCFSTENWSRPEKEVAYLMQFPIRFYKKNREKLLNSDYKIMFSGRRDRFSPELTATINEIEEKTKNHQGLIINICFDYGSYTEITEAVKQIAALYKDNAITLDDITPELINNHLYTKDLPPVDLMIRTSGEERISNFLLWQIAYAELYFTKTLWPDFDEKELEKAILSYQMRHRRFGGLEEEQK